MFKVTLVGVTLNTVLKYTGKNSIQSNPSSIGFQGDFEQLTKGECDPKYPYKIHSVTRKGSKPPQTFQSHPGLRYLGNPYTLRSVMGTGHQ